MLNDFMSTFFATHNYLSLERRCSALRQVTKTSKMPIRK